MRRAARGTDRRERRAAWLFVSPWALGFLAFTAGPLVLDAGLVPDPIGPRAVLGVRPEYLRMVGGDGHDHTFSGLGRGGI